MSPMGMAEREGAMVSRIRSSSISFLCCSHLPNSDYPTNSFLLKKFYHSRNGAAMPLRINHENRIPLWYLLNSYYWLLRTRRINDGLYGR